MKQIAFFDFDGTITKKDTLLEFIKFARGKFPFYTGFLYNVPILFAYKAGIISNQKAKEKVLEYFFGSMSLPEFQQHCLHFAESVLPKLVRPKAVEEMQKLKNNGAEVVIVTASAENWVKPWADAMQVELIGTKLQLDAEKITGKILDINCHGDEKVRRIKEKYTLVDYEKIYAYGDTFGDKPMLAIAHESYYKPFR